MWDFHLRRYADPQGAMHGCLAGVALAVGARVACKGLPYRWALVAAHAPGAVCAALLLLAGGDGDMAEDPEMGFSHSAHDAVAWWLGVELVAFAAQHLERLLLRKKSLIDDWDVGDAGPSVLLGLLAPLFLYQALRPFFLPLAAAWAAVRALRDAAAGGLVLARRRPLGARGLLRLNAAAAAAELWCVVPGLLRGVRMLERVFMMDFGLFAVESIALIALQVAFCGSRLWAAAGELRNLAPAQVAADPLGRVAEKRL